MRVVTSNFSHIKTDDLTEIYSAIARVIARATCLVCRWLGIFVKKVGLQKETTQLSERGIGWRREGCFLNFIFSSRIKISVLRIITSFKGI